MGGAVRSFTMVGSKAVPVQVEVDLINRLPRMMIVGLPPSQDRETCERVRAAITAAGFEFPRKRIVVSVGSAVGEVRGTGLDLPIAVAILQASGQLPETDDAYLGELGLDGSIRSVRGAVGAAMENPKGSLVVSVDAAPVLASVGKVLVTSNLSDLRGPLSPMVETVSPIEYPAAVDTSEIHGNRSALPQILEAIRQKKILLLVGIPGVGKSMIARRICGILPKLNLIQQTEIARIHDAAGFALHTLPTHRPFRAPHHTVSVGGLTGDRAGRPGEMALATHGVLFLDEASEFPLIPMQAITRAYRESPSFHLVLAVNDDAEVARVKRMLGQEADRLAVVRLERIPTEVIIARSDAWPSSEVLREQVAI